MNQDDLKGLFDRFTLTLSEDEQEFVRKYDLFSAGWEQRIPKSLESRIASQSIIFKSEAYLVGVQLGIRY